MNYTSPTPPHLEHAHPATSGLDEEQVLTSSARSMVHMYVKLGFTIHTNAAHVFLPPLSIHTSTRVRSRDSHIKRKTLQQRKNRSRIFRSFILCSTWHRLPSIPWHMPQVHSSTDLFPPCDTPKTPAAFMLLLGHVITAILMLLLGLGPLRRLTVPASHLHLPYLPLVLHLDPLWLRGPHACETLAGRLQSLHTVGPAACTLRVRVLPLYLKQQNMSSPDYETQP